MKVWIGLAILIFAGAAGWRIGDLLSSDALSMAVGVLFGVMAGVPTALLVMAGSRRRHHEDGSEEARLRQQQWQPLPMHGQAQGQMQGWAMPHSQQPPIIVVAGPQGSANTPQSSQSNNGWLLPEPPARHFTVVGEREEFVDEW